MSAWMAVPLLCVAVSASAGDHAQRYRGRTVRDVKIAFEGEALPEASRDLIEIEPGSLYRPEVIRRSIKQLFSLGAFSDIKVEAERVGEEVDVMFRLYPRLQIEAIRVAGLERFGINQSNMASRLTAESRLQAGAPFEVDQLSPAAARIRAYLHEQGYLWAEVEPEASFQSPTAIVVFHVDPGRQARIGALEIEGVAPHVEAHVRRELSLTPGKLYSRVELADDIDRIVAGWNERGFYQAGIDFIDSPRESAVVDIKLDATLGPRVLVEVTGVELSEKKVRELVPIFEELRLTEDLIEESRANIVAYLEEDGYRNARVEVARNTESSLFYLQLRFDVTPGPRYQVLRIEIDGVDSATATELRSLFVTRTRRRFRSAPFQERVWNDDIREARTYLLNQGYHQLRLQSSETVDPGDAESLVLKLHAELGARAFVDSVEIEGALEVSSLDVLEASGVAPGQPFNASQIVEARERLATFYRNQGFRHASVEAGTELNAEASGAAVTFRVQEGERTIVDRVILAGLGATKESAIRRSLTVQSGDPLSSQAILETRQNLIGTGLFRDVRIEVLPRDPVTRRSDILISLEEGPRTSFAYGFGFEETELLRAQVELTRRNLFGRNRSVSVFTRASFRGGRFITTYRQPELLGLNLPIFVSAFAEQQDRPSFDYDRVGVGAQISKRLNPNETMFLRYRLDRTDVFRLEVDIDEIDRRFRDTFISAISLATVTDKRDDPINPHAGQFRILDVEWSAKMLGTRSPYLKGLAQQFVYFSLPKNMTLAVGGRLGLAKTLRDDGVELLPIAERFFAGGSTTLRGFALDRAGPTRKLVVDDLVIHGEPLGGNVLTLLNLELRFPIVGPLRGVLFSDNGNVQRDLQVAELFNWRYNMGFGFRYDTPLGPLRVDYGFKLDRRTELSIYCPVITQPCTESLGRWHVSLGHAF